MTTKEVIEWFAEHHKELRYNEDGLITNIVRTMNDGRIHDSHMYIHNFDFSYYKSLSIKQKQYKPYDKVETWMLGKRLIAKYNPISNFQIDWIGWEGVRTNNGTDYKLDELFELFIYEDGKPFGEEVV